MYYYLHHDHNHDRVISILAREGVFFQKTLLGRQLNSDCFAGLTNKVAVSSKTKIQIIFEKLTENFVFRVINDEYFLVVQVCH